MCSVNQVIKQQSQTVRLVMMNLCMQMVMLCYISAFLLYVMLSVMNCHANTEKIARTSLCSRAMLIFNAFN